MEDKMTIDDYIEAIIPIIRACRKFTTKSSYTAHTLHYLYRQAFYGFFEFGECGVSENAQKKYQELKTTDDVTTKTVNDQRKFERKKCRSQSGGAIFHLEHVYTGSMFHEDIDALNDDEITVEAIKNIVEKNYKTAWITKEEDVRLTKAGFKSQREEDAYEKVGITLLKKGSK